MEEIDQQLLTLFIEEIKDRTSAIEKLLIDLENAKSDEDRSTIVRELMRIAHSLKGASGFAERRAIESACHWMEDKFTGILNNETELSQAVIDRLFAVNDVLIYHGKGIESGESIDDARLRALLDEKVPLRRSRIKETVTPAKEIKNDDAEANFLVNRRRDRSADQETSIKLSAARLDSLLYRIEELLLLRSRNKSRKAEVDDLQAVLADVLDKMENVEVVARLSRGLRELSGKIDEDLRLLETASGQLENEIRRARMLSFNFACNGLSRVVRDTSNKLGKNVRLVIEGGEVEIDRSIVNNLNDLLRHLVRNAIDHGIETPEKRKAKGKPAIGKITIIAQTAGDRLRIKVLDDGKGIDIEALREVYNKQGHPDGSSERVLLRHLFTAGFSTADAITEISGRGVGLDIVKRAVEKMRGVIEASNNSEGGATFAIALPLSMSTTRALIISVGEGNYALETSAARRIVKFSMSDVTRQDGNLVLTYNNKEIPALDLGGWLLGEGASIFQSKSFNAVIIGTIEKETALLVSRVVGEEEILVRTLGPRLNGIRKYSGAATLHDGSVILILNPSSLVEAAVGIEAFQKPQSKSLIRVLVVDDSPTVRGKARLSLEDGGVEVFEAEDGSDAWGWLKNNLVDIVIADVDMPNMNGFDLTSKIRKSTRLKSLPVIIVTARDGEEDRAKSQQVGATAFLNKNDYTPEKVLELVRGLYSQRRA